LLLSQRVAGGVLLLLLLLRGVVPLVLVLVLVLLLLLLLLLMMVVSATAAVGFGRSLLALVEVMLLWRVAGVIQSSKLMVIWSSHCGGMMLWGRTKSPATCGLRLWWL